MHQVEVDVMRLGGGLAEKKIKQMLGRQWRLYRLL
jgi:hypothetical protein